MARGRYDVMISYAWKGSKQLVEDVVVKRLKAEGILVWVDVERMQGKMNEAMSQAVAESSIILVVYSEDYENSKNCRAELEYARHLNKRIVPINGGAEGWKPRIGGWLDFLLAECKYYRLPQDTESLIRNIHMQLQEECDVREQRSRTVSCQTSQGLFETFPIQRRDSTKSSYSSSSPSSSSPLPLSPSASNSYNSKTFYFSHRKSRENLSEAKTPSSAPMRFCFQCGSLDHVKSFCPDIVCWTCGQKGHVQLYCQRVRPNPRMNFSRSTHPRTSNVCFSSVRPKMAPPLESQRSTYYQSPRQRSFSVTLDDPFEESPLDLSSKSSDTTSASTPTSPRLQRHRRTTGEQHHPRHQQQQHHHQRHHEHNQLQYNRNNYKLQPQNPSQQSLFHQQPGPRHKHKKPQWMQEPQQHMQLQPQQHMQPPQHHMQQHQQPQQRSTHLPHASPCLTPSPLASPYPCHAHQINPNHPSPPPATSHTYNRLHPHPTMARSTALASSMAQAQFATQIASPMASSMSQAPFATQIASPMASSMAQAPFATQIASSMSSSMAQVPFASPMASPIAFPVPYHYGGFPVQVGFQTGNPNFLYGYDQFIASASSTPNARVDVGCSSIYCNADHLRDDAANRHLPRRPATPTTSFCDATDLRPCTTGQLTPPPPPPPPPPRQSRLRLPLRETTPTNDDDDRENSIRSIPVIGQTASLAGEETEMSSWVVL